MKIKTDFTTNSSSSSFVCWGILKDTVDDMESRNVPFPLETGGFSGEYIGITPLRIFKDFPDVKFGDVKKFVADKMSSVLGTHLEESDIAYYEEGWYDG